MLYGKTKRGRLWHRLTTREETKALCGYDPTSALARVRLTRGRWDVLQTEAPRGFHCYRCMLKWRQQCGSEATPG